MSAGSNVALQADVIGAAEAAQPVTFRRTIASEWIKFRTLRSTWITLGIAVIAMIVIGVLIAINTRSLAGIQAEDWLPSATLQGAHLAELLIGSLGVLFVSGEYGTGTIRSTFVAVPTRLPVLWAKAVVFLLVTLVLATALSVVTFVVSEAVLAQYRPGYSLSDPGVLRMVLLHGVYLALAGLLGSGIGWLVRNTAGALVVYVALMLVLPVVFGTLLGKWGGEVAQYLPSQAGASFIQSLPDSPSLSAGVGFAVLVGWVLVAFAGAAVTLRRRDA